MSRGLLSFLLLIRLAGAADIRSFQISRTVGAADGAAWGTTLLEVEQTNDGSLVRFVYTGLGDFVCRRSTVMVWQKRIVGKTPTDFARPANLCPSERHLKSLQSRLEKFRWKQSIGIEQESAVFHAQCGEGRQLFLPIELVGELESRVEAAAWGHRLDLYKIDAAAERDGEEFAEMARQSNYGIDYTVAEFHRLLSDYKGPIGKLDREWRVETGSGLRLRQFVEPPEVLLAHVQSKSSSLQFQLTLDRRSGKVLKSESLVDSTSRYVSAVWGASLGWVFDPSTIPENPVVNITVHFHANCGGQDY